MKLQIITNLFPLPWEPNRATFNKQQFENIAREHEVRITVIVAWMAGIRNYFKKGCFYNFQIMERRS